MAQKVCLPDGVTDLNVYLLGFCQRYVTPGCLLTVHLNLEPHVTVSVRRTTAVGRNMTRWIFFVFVVDCKVTLGRWRQSIHPSSLAFARHPPRFTAKRGQFNVAQGATGQGAIKGVLGWAWAIL